MIPVTVKFFMWNVPVCGAPEIVQLEDGPHRFWEFECSPRNRVFRERVVEGESLLHGRVDALSKFPDCTIDKIVNPRRLIPASKEAIAIWFESHKAKNYQRQTEGVCGA